MAYRPGWVDHLIGWHVYPLGFVGEDLARLFREMAETGLPAKGLVAVN
jgi:hypothetical protein